MTATREWPILAPPPPPDLAPGPVPTFSVLVAAFNVAAYIGDALRSAFAQEPEPYEVIVVDDGSTDDLDAALVAFRDRITVLRQDNRGESAAKNAAARAASGDFVVILDADDVDLPGRLAALGTLASARPDLDLLATDALLVDGDRVLRRYHEPYNPFPVDDQRATILERNFLASPAVRRSRWEEVGGYDESIRYGADWECWMRMILAGARAGLVDVPLFRYRQRPGSLSHDRSALLAGRVTILEKVARDARLTSGERSRVGRALSTARLRYAREALRTSADGARDAVRAVARDRGRPARDRVWAAAALVAPRAVGRRVRSSDD